MWVLKSVLDHNILNNQACVWETLFSFLIETPSSRVGNMNEWREQRGPRELIYLPIPALSQLSRFLRRGMVTQTKMQERKTLIPVSVAECHAWKSE